MFSMYNSLGLGPGFIALIMTIAMWDLFWKGWALWKAGRNDSLAWCIILLIFNTAGILPLLSLLFFQKQPWYKNSKKTLPPAPKAGAKPKGAKRKATQKKRKR